MNYSSNIQVSLVPPPWLELTTSEPSFSATRVSPPGTMVWGLSPVTTKGSRSTGGGPARAGGCAFAPRQHKGAQIDMARRKPAGGAGRAGRERQRRLRDKTFGLALELVAESLDRRLGRGGADQHAIAAGAVDFL